MTAGSASGTLPVLVLALGNPLLHDDGVGQRILEGLLGALPDSRVEYLDGGTQGLNLLGRLSGRSALLILDAVGLDAPAGTVCVLRGEQVRSNATSRTAHEGNAGELLAAARLTGDWVDDTVVVGIVPEDLSTGIGLSPNVARALPDAVSAAARVLAEMAEHPGH